MKITEDYKKVCDNLSGEEFEIICESIQLRINIGYFFFSSGLQERLQCMIDENIIKSFKIENNKIYIEEKQCIENNIKCCCICSYHYTNKLYSQKEQCKIKNKHGICKEYVQI